MSNTTRADEAPERVTHYSGGPAKPALCGATKPPDYPLITTSTAKSVSCEDCIRISHQRVPQPDERCVKCRHNNVAATGYCNEPLNDPRSARKFCGCKCDFTSSTESEKCELYGTKGNEGCRVHRYVPCPSLDPVPHPLDVSAETASEKHPCPRCNGSGFESDSHTPCEWCGGDGWMLVPPNKAVATETGELRECIVCLLPHHGYDEQGYAVSCPNGVVLDARARVSPVADATIEEARSFIARDGSVAIDRKYAQEMVARLLALLGRR